MSEKFSKIFKIDFISILKILNFSLTGGKFNGKSYMWYLAPHNGLHYEISDFGPMFCRKNRDF